MTDEPAIPSELLARAYHYSNGELWWPPTVAPVVTEWAAGAACAVLGGEWLMPMPNGTTWAFVPAIDGHPPMIYVWSVDPGWQDSHETWEAFCRRAADHTLSVLRGTDGQGIPLPTVEEGVRREHLNLWPYVYYNLTLATRTQYEELGSFRRRLPLIALDGDMTDGA